MGRTYGRTMYWIWIENTLKRVQLCPGVLIIKKVAHITCFIQGTSDCFYIDPRALAQTKKIALDNKEEMKKYAIHNI